MSNILRGAQETLPEYHFRLYSTKDEHGLSNQAIADLLNKEYGTNYDESKFRKEYQAYTRVWQEMIESKKLSSIPEEFAEELAREQLKFNEKNRALTKMLQDQRREYRKLLDKEARFMHLKQEVMDSIEPIAFETNFPFVEVNKADNEQELLVLMSDWHLGATYNGRFGFYNVDECKKRVRYFLEETIREIKKNNHHTVHLAQLGDAISGEIHVGNRVAAEESAIQQIMMVTELLLEFVVQVAKIVPNVHYYNIGGNHSRTQSSKSDVRSHEDNFEKLILWQLQARLQNFDNIVFHEDSDGLIETNILGEEVLLAHGDLDKNVNGSDKLSQMTGKVYSHICLGHTHHSFEKNWGITTVHVNPSLIGHDNYSASGRFGGRAGQKIITFEKSSNGKINHTVKLINL